MMCFVIPPFRKPQTIAIPFVPFVPITVSGEEGPSRAATVHEKQQLAASTVEEQRRQPDWPQQDGEQMAKTAPLLSDNARHHVRAALLEDTKRRIEVIKQAASEKIRDELERLARRLDEEDRENTRRKREADEAQKELSTEQARWYVKSNSESLILLFRMFLGGVTQTDIVGQGHFGRRISGFGLRYMV